MSPSRTCIGFGHRLGRCGRAPDAKLNPSRLWCSNCERARRVYLTRQFKAIARAYRS